MKRTVRRAHGRLSGTRAWRWFIDKPWDDCSWAERVIHVVLGLVVATVAAACFIAVVVFFVWLMHEGDVSINGDSCVTIAHVLQFATWRRLFG
jgi:hypothetical protein